MKVHSRNFILLFLFGTVYCLTFINQFNIGVNASSSHGQQGVWLSHGGNEHNTRHANDLGYTPRLFSRTLDNLSPIWRFDMEAHASCTPSVYENTVYFTSFDGNIYAVKKTTGALVWSQSIYSYTGILNDYARNTPTISSDGKHMIIGSQKSGYVIDINPENGNMRWRTLINTHPHAIVTMSPTIYDGRVYIGASSDEEAAAADPDYDCCTFVGNFVALDIKNGDILWNFRGIDINVPTGLDQYAGVGIWGSSPAISTKYNQVYIGTGNTYSNPASVDICQDGDITVDSCVDSRVYFDSVVALNMYTGHIDWVTRYAAYDSWVLSCQTGTAPLNCPDTPGPDADFGMAPAFVPGATGTKDKLIIAQKNGQVHALDPEDGSKLWTAQTSPGGTLGGHNWGASTDGIRYYVGAVNSYHEDYDIEGPSTLTINGGAVVAVDILDGSIAWTTPDPNAFSGESLISGGSSIIGPTTVLNDIVIAASAARTGTVLILSKYTGEILYQYDTGATIYGGAGVSDNCFFISAGYNAFFNPPYWKDGTQLIAFCTTYSDGTY